MRRLLAFVPLAILTAGTAAAVGLALSEAPGGHPAATALFAPTVHIFPDPGSTPLPAFCAFGYPSNRYPPPRDPGLDDRLLTKADVPAGMSQAPPLYPSNGPGFDDFAVGFPKYPITGISFAIPRNNDALGISELLGQAPSPQAAGAQVTFAVGKVYGDCMQIAASQPGESYPLPPSEDTFVALKLMSGTSYSSSANVVVFGSVGDYVFEVVVGNLIAYPATGIATYPTQAQVVATVQAVTAHLTS